MPPGSHRPSRRFPVRPASQDRRRAAVARGPARHHPRRGAGPLFEDRTGRLRRRHQRLRPRTRRSAVPDRSDDRGRPQARLAARRARRAGGGQALHRRHSGQPHLDAGGAHRHRARHAVPEDLVARHHLAGRHRRHDGDAGRGGAAVRAPQADRPRHQRMPGLGRRGRAVAGRRHPDLGRAAAGHRLAGADGGVDPVEEDCRRLDAPGAGHPGRPHREGAVDAGGAASAQAVRVRRDPCCTWSST